MLIPLARPLAALLAAWAPFVASGGVRPLSFLPHVEYEMSGSEPHDVVVGFFNDDSFPDLAVCVGVGDAGDGVSILLGDGTGAFADSVAYHVGVYAYGLAANDFDEDGIADLAVAVGGRDAAAVKILLGRGDGDGRFDTGVTLTPGSFPVGVVSADLNNDLHADLAVANNVSRGMTVFLGAGDGTFSAPLHVAEAQGYLATGIDVGDFDENGAPDLVLSHYGGVSVFLGNGDGTFARAGGAGSAFLTEDVAVGDLNGDGHDDVASVELYQGRLVVLYGSGTGSFGGVTYVSLGGFLQDVEIASVNDDAKPDLVVAYQEGHRAIVVLGSGGGEFETPLSFATGSQPAAVAAGDWNADGYTDLALPLRNLGDTAYVTVLTQIEPPPWKAPAANGPGERRAVQGARRAVPRP